MLLAHSLIGLLPVDDRHFSVYWFLGSVVADIDHIFIILKYKIFSFGKLINALRFEDKYNLRFKTKYFHSFFGMIITTVFVFLINKPGAYYFFIGYLIHLLLDWFDRDEKQYLYPLKFKARGWLPIGSKTEIIFTLMLGIINLYLFLYLV